MMMVPEITTICTAMTRMRKCNTGTITLRVGLHYLASLTPYVLLSPSGILAAKARRQDSLARFLSQRPKRNELMRKELMERNIIPRPEVERQEEKNYINNKLNRRLSLRPTPEELKEKHILLSTLMNFFPSAFDNSVMCTLLL
jgi:hypothetical protein